MKIENVFLEFNETLLHLYPSEEIKSIVYILLDFYSNMDKAKVLLNKTSDIEVLNISKINSALERLSKGEPIQYILGETEFYGRILNVDSSTLIPRPETEELVEWIVSDNKNKAVSILDIGTGSGAIAISLACELPNAKISALDISTKALSMAEANAKLHDKSINFIELDILNKDIDLNTQFDIIVSNPPYVMDLEKELMRKNVLEYEPHSALFVENNKPLVFYEAIAFFAKIHLAENGCIYFEINESLGKETSKMLLNHFHEVVLRKDLSDKNRIIKASRLKL